MAALDKQSACHSRSEPQARVTGGQEGRGLAESAGGAARNYSQGRDRFSGNLPAAGLQQRGDRAPAGEFRPCASTAGAGIAPPAAAHAERLVRQFSAAAIWLLVINGTIGAGIFGVPAEAARLTGAWSPLMFVLCGLLMAPIILCFGEVASYFRNTGGPILYATTAFGPFIGFQTGWALYVARVTSFAANINLLVSSLGWFWPASETGGLRLALLFAICAGLTWVNVVGARHAMRSVGALTVLKLLPLCALVAFGLSRIDLGELVVPAAPLPAYSDIGAAALLLIYAYVGWESALIPAGEARDPTRDIPRALIWGLVVTTILYVLVQSVSIAALPGLGASTRPLVDVAAIVLGPAGATILTAGVIASVGGNVAASMFSAPRITYSMARDSNLPAWFGSVHPRFLTPANSVVAYGALIFLAAAFGSFAWLAGMSALTRLAIYLLCIGALPRLRRMPGDPAGRLQLPGGWLIPVAGAAVCLWLLLQVRLDAVAVTLGFLAVGAVLHFVARRGRPGASA